MAIVPGVEHLVAALREKDRTIVQHAERAARYAYCIGQALGLKPGQLSALYKGGVLHDLGKLSVPQSVLEKPGPLTAEEWAIVRLHPLEGFKRLQGRIEDPALDVVLCHHEWYDGRGYPRRLRADEIPILARVFAIGDAFDAMTAYRMARRPLRPEEAREEILLCAGTQFDPILVEAFSDVLPSIWEHGDVARSIRVLGAVDSIPVMSTVLPIRQW